MKTKSWVPLVLSAFDTKVQSLCALPQEGLIPVGQNPWCTKLRRAAGFYVLRARLHLFICALCFFVQLCLTGVYLYSIV